MPDHMFPDEETTEVRLSMPTDDWMDWRRTLPGTVPIYKRVHELIRQDTVGVDELDQSDVRLISLKFQRIKQRASRVEAMLEKDDTDMADVAEELEAMKNIASEYLD